MPSEGTGARRGSVFRSNEEERGEREGGTMGCIEGPRDVDSLMDWRIWIALGICSRVPWRTVV